MLNLPRNCEILWKKWRKCEDKGLKSELNKERLYYIFLQINYELNKEKLYYAYLQIIPQYFGWDKYFILLLKLVTVFATQKTSHKTRVQPVSQIILHLIFYYIRSKMLQNLIKVFQINDTFESHAKWITSSRYFATFVWCAIWRQNFATSFGIISNGQFLAMQFDSFFDVFVFLSRNVAILVT